GTSSRRSRGRRPRHGGGAMPKREDVRTAMVIGSGPIVIGQAAEFDYSGSQACRSLREEGVRVILVNSNPATIQTDPETADAVYVEPLTVPFIEKVIAKERPQGILSGMGGQTALNLCSELSEAGVLSRHGVELLGTKIEAITAGEDRQRFADLMRSIGEPIPRSRAVSDSAAAAVFVEETGDPVIVRAAYALGWSGSGIAHTVEEHERGGPPEAPRRRPPYPSGPRRRGRVQHPVRRPPGDRRVSGDRSQPAGLAPLRTRVEGDGLPDRANRGEDRDRLVPRRDPESGHGQDARVVRADLGLRRH